MKDARTGKEITEAKLQNGVMIWTVNNPLYFKVVRILETTGFPVANVIDFEVWINSTLRRRLDLHKCFLKFRIWTSVTPSAKGFLDRLCFSVNQYLNSMHVISINLVLLAVKNFLSKYDRYIFSVIETHDIKFNI